MEALCAALWAKLLDGATPATRLAAAAIILDPRAADAIAFHSEQHGPGARW